MMMQEPDAGQFNGLDPRQISGVSTGEGSGYNFSFDIAHGGAISISVGHFPEPGSMQGHLHLQQAGSGSVHKGLGQMGRIPKDQLESRLLSPPRPLPHPPP